MTSQITKTFDLKAPIERVWRALTDREEFGTWFQVKLDGPFVVGEVQTGQMTYDGCAHTAWRSKVEVMDAPHRFVFTWPHPANPADEHASASAPVTRVEFLLQSIASGTRLTVTESGFDAIPDAQRMTVLRNNEGGWSLQMIHITAHVED